MRDLPNECEDDGFCATNYGDLPWFIVAALGLGLFGESIHEATPPDIYINNKYHHSVPNYIKSAFYIPFIYLYIPAIFLL